MREYILNSNPLSLYAIKSDAVIAEGDMIAIDANAEALPAADAASIKVAGVCMHITPDNMVEVKDGIFPFANSTANPLTRAHRNTLVYVEDKDTVSSDPGSHAVIAGVLIDVYNEEAYVDNRPASIAAAVGPTPEATEIPVAAIVAPTYVVPAAATYAAPEGGDTTDTEARAALALLATDHAASRAAIAQLAADNAALITALQTAGLMASE